MLANFTLFGMLTFRFSPTTTCKLTRPRIDKSNPVTSVRRTFPGSPIEKCVKARIDPKLVPNVERLEWLFEERSAKVWRGEKDDSGEVAAYMKFKDGRYSFLFSLSLSSTIFFLLTFSKGRLI